MTFWQQAFKTIEYHYTQQTRNKFLSRYFRSFNLKCFPRHASYVASHTMGIDHLKNRKLNKGLAFSLEERQVLGIHGLMPPRIKTQGEQAELCRISVSRFTDSIEKYMYLAELFDRNEKLFFRLLTDNVEELMSIVYTPTVGLACQRFGFLYRQPHGLFITGKDRGHCYEILKNWPSHRVKAIVVTDGERILGLGDLGANGMGIPIGKMALYTALAGVKPYMCLPVVLDVGTDNENLLNDPFYIGLRHKRIRGKVYDDFIDEFMEAVVKRYGQTTLIQFEDFANRNAFRLLRRYRDRYCTFNDDIQGTASVAVAGLLASARVTEKKLGEHKLLFLGAGGAGLGIADLCVNAMQLEGVSQSEARDRIWLVDVEGLVVKERKDLDAHRADYAKNYPPTKDLLSIVMGVKPSILIGVSTATGAFTPEILQAMASMNETPIIFALSNPTDKAECTAEQAYVNTEGRAVFCSGSPFAPVKYNGKTYVPGQGNNAYIFPGVSLGVIMSGMYHIPDEVFIVAAQTLAQNVTVEDLAMGSLYPPVAAIKKCSIQIATAICQYAYDKGFASVYPEPKDKTAYIEANIYSYAYKSSLVNKWNWPREPTVKLKSVESSLRRYDELL